MDNIEENGFRVSAFLKKLKGSHPLPPRPGIKEIVWSFVGGFLGIALVAFLTTNFNMQLLWAPLGATAVLIYGLHDASVSQPRNVVGGYIICAIGGVLMFNILGNTWFPMALATALSIATMQITRTVHPPAGAVTLIAVIQGEGMKFVLAVIAGVALLLITALIVNNICRHRRYPSFW